MEELPIRVQARAVVINGAGEILLVRHEDTVPADPNEPDRLTYWVVPGGMLDAGESFEACAMREAEEETGVKGLRFVRELFVYRKPLQYAQGMRMMEAHYLFFHCEGQPEVAPNDPDENITDVRWWKLEEIQNSADDFVPTEFFADLPDIVRTASLPSAAR